MNVEIGSSDVIRLILQFLKENRLTATQACLERESQVALNAVDNVKQIVGHVQHGRWDQALDLIPATLPAPAAHDLYEQIVVELAELGDADTARALLSNAPALLSLRASEATRYRRLERIVADPNPSDLYPGGESRESRRASIASALQRELCVVPPSRLLSLLMQALKWQQHQGMLSGGASQVDLFRGAAQSAAQAAADQLVIRNDRVIKLGKMNHAECVAFSRDGAFLVVGSADGFVEVYDSETGRLRKDLKFQADEHFMMHDDAVLCMDFARDGDLLATGSKDGQVKVWRVRTGACVKRFPAAHVKGVTSLQFSRDSTQVLTGSYDGSVRVHGLRSGRTLKEFRGHRSFVNSVTFSEDCSRVYSGSSDGCVLVFDARSTDVIATWKPYPQSAIDVPVLQLLWMTGVHDQLVVVTRSNEILILNATSGDTIRTLTHGKTGIDSQFVNACVSGRGRYLYACGADSILYMFDMQSGDVAKVIKAHNADVLGVVHHPFVNTLATFSSDSTVKLWKP